MKSNKTKEKYLNLTDENSIPQISVRETIKYILFIAEKELGIPRKEMTVLDIGSGFGMCARELAKQVKKVVGVEPFAGGYKKSIELHRAKNIQFVNACMEDYKGNEKFDLAISLNTIEHMPKAEKSYRNAFKYMKKKSLLYLTAPNKLWPIEPHYALPFLSFLPLPAANLYLRLTGKGNSYKDSSYSLTYFGMKKLFDRFPYRYYFLVPPSDAAYIGCKSKVLKGTGIWLIKKFPIFWFISKGFILVVKKGE